MNSKIKQSAGIVLYRFNKNNLEILLVHPGGPFWAKKDIGAWSIPKGEFEKEEEGLAAARREFLEETGFEINGKFIELKPVKQKNGKTIYAWALEGDLNASKVKSNNFDLEWPPRSGKIMQFPEIDKAEWFSISEAREKINIGQLEIINQCEAILLQKK